MASTRSLLKTPRASVACTKCRLRKVRCDVSRRGHPCNNCELDHKECVVISKRRKPRSHLHTPPAIQNESVPRLRLKSSDTRPVDIAFHAYPFIKTDFLTRLAHHETSYLDSQSCFRLPTRPLWDTMIQAYFRHINPVLPLFNEVTFLEESRETGPATLSLFTAQAILFAACPFVSRCTIKECGFANYREARAAFYFRAKVKIKINPIPMSDRITLTFLTSSRFID